MSQSLQSARRHYLWSAALARRAVREARKAARAESQTGLTVANVVAAHQVAGAAQAPAAMARMLAEQGNAESMQALLNPTAFATPPVLVQEMLRQVEDEQDRLQQNIGWQFDRLVASLVADAARGAESVSITATPNTVWTRYLNPPSCSRCALLAGRVYRWSDGFDRHTGCDCMHVATNEEVAPGLVSDPSQMLADGQVTNLSRADRMALANGASWSQVINAKSGMRNVDLYGRRTQITTAGTTRRGAFGSSEFAQRAGYTRDQPRRQGAVANYSTRRTQRVRLTPRAIYKAAGDNRDEAVRLLGLYGYLQ